MIREWNYKVKPGIGTTSPPWCRTQAKAELDCKEQFQSPILWNTQSTTKFVTRWLTKTSMGWKKQNLWCRAELTCRAAQSRARCHETRETTPSALVSGLASDNPMYFTFPSSTSFLSSSIYSNPSTKIHMGDDNCNTNMEGDGEW